MSTHTPTTLLDAARRYRADADTHSRAAQLANGTDEPARAAHSAIYRLSSDRMQACRAAAAILGAVDPTSREYERAVTLVDRAISTPDQPAARRAASTLWRLAETVCPPRWWDDGILS